MLNRYEVTRCTIEKLRKFPIRRYILSFYTIHYEVRSILGQFLPYYRPTFVTSSAKQNQPLLLRYRYTDFNFKVFKLRIFIFEYFIKKLYLSKKLFFSCSPIFVEVLFPHLLRINLTFLRRFTIPPCPRGESQILSWDVDFFTSSMFFRFKMIISNRVPLISPPQIWFKFDTMNHHLHSLI